MTTTTDETLESALNFEKTQVRDLQRTVIALRDTLEQAQADRLRDVQATKATAQTEIDQLKKTVVALRDKLELQQVDAQRDLQKIQASATDELRQLHATIAALRDQLEAATRRPGA